MNKLFQWFLTTRLGDLYFRFLLWRDRKSSSDVKYLTPKEAITITKQYNLLYQGVGKIKKEVNNLINCNSSEEYDRVLRNIEDMTKLASRDENSPEAKFAKILKSIKAKKGNRDIVTHTDHVKMIDNRINDYKELQGHVEKRNLMRSIRKAKKEGNKEKLLQLETEWKEKYGC